MLFTDKPPMEAYLVFSLKFNFKYQFAIMFF